MALMVLGWRGRIAQRFSLGKTSPFKRMIIIAVRLGAVSWGGFVAQIPLLERLLCTGDDGIELELVRSWEHRAIVLPGPSYVNFVAIAGYELAGIVGAFLLPVILLAPGSLVVCLALELSTVYLGVQKIVSGIDVLSVFVIAAGLVSGALRFLRRGTGSLFYAASIVGFYGLIFLGVNPGLSLGAVVVGSLAIKAGGNKITSVSGLKNRKANVYSNDCMEELP